MALVILSPTALFIGLCFCAASIGDCDLVSIADPMVVRQDGQTANGFGFLTYKDSNTGQCYYWSDNSVESIPYEGNITEPSNTTETSDESDTTDAIDVSDENVNNATNATNLVSTVEQFTQYLFEVLGKDWYVAMAFAGGAFILAAFLFLYSLSFFCSVQVKGCRFLLAMLSGIVLVLLQALGTTFVFLSDWCDMEGCGIGRTTIFSMAAGLSFLISGIFFRKMTDWPGQKILEDLDRKRTWFDPYAKERAKTKKNKRNSRKNLPASQVRIPDTYASDIEDGLEQTHNSYSSYKSKGTASNYSQKKTYSSDGSFNSYNKRSPRKARPKKTAVVDSTGRVSAGGVKPKSISVRSTRSDLDVAVENYPADAEDANANDNTHTFMRELKAMSPLQKPKKKTSSSRGSQQRAADPYGMVIDASESSYCAATASSAPAVEMASFVPEDDYSSTFNSEE